MNKNLSYLSVLFCLFFIPSVWGKIPQNRVVQTIEIDSAEFGLFNPPESGKPFFIPTKSIPLIENQGYGWLIVLKTNKLKVKWREEFTLPSSPKTWGADETLRLTLSNDRKTSVLEREEKLDRGMIFNVWTVAPGDPQGRYVIRVIIDGMVERTFEFDVH